MPAYIIAEITVTDPDRFARYRAEVSRFVAAHGGRYLVRGGKTAALDGNWEPGRLIILEFPDMGCLQAFWDSADYAPLRVLRESASTARVLAVEGWAPAPQ